MNFLAEAVSLKETKTVQMNETAIYRSSRVLIVDDQKIIRQGLRMLLQAQDEFQVVGDSNGDGAIAAALACRPEVVIMDLALPDIATGMRRLTQLRECIPDARVIIFSTDENQPDLMYRAIQHGAVGYLLRSHSDVEEVAAAIRTVARGEVFVSAAALATLIQSIQDENEPVSVRPIMAADRLTARENDVLNLVAQGCTNRQIAGRLVISESTARSHLHNILDKLQMSNRVQAAAYALRLREPVTQ